ncbi:ATP-binding protein [Limnohabitans sp. Rim11]|jgi:nitrogen fixation/metabolism regulation signal transduction histidine kinase|uniref:sensor histidine kinase n=1 Tax=Limnohabitans sp. Rim11 TaxID=1100719 RepID=UPI000A78B474|nr:ATP-binding protein [Limnohabitans sp. Rim11]
MNRNKTERIATGSQSSKTVRWMMGIGVILMLILGLGLLVLLTQATGNRALYDRNYDRLYAVNMVVAGLLLLGLLWGASRLIIRLRQGQFGSRLLVKLAAIFALVGVVPGVLIYVVSYQFVSRSIESWFDVKVEGALVAGLNLGRVTLDTLTADLAKQSRVASQQLVDVQEASAAIALDRVRSQMDASDAVLWALDGRLIASAGSSRFAVRPERPTAAQFKQVRSKLSLEIVEGLDENAGISNGRIKVLTLVPQNSLNLRDDPWVLQISQNLPATLVANALDVQSANREYQERALARDGLRKMYIGTLTLSLIMAVLAAVLIAMFLGNQLARPLLLLALGMRQVAAGDLSPKYTLQRKDELGGLTRSFAEMTQQLSDARSTVERSLNQLDAARGNLQTILDNLTAGVIVLNARGIIQSSNPGATRILKVPLAAHEKAPFINLPNLQNFAAGVQEQFELLSADKDRHELDHWQKSFEIHASGQGLEATSVTLVARGAILPDGMRLLVFDDISEIVSAQRSQAWGEVARRLAHEIKNPLTPIQLSAERLERKLDGKLEESDQTVLSKSVKTIVDQVAAMKRLVNEFRDYARLPSAELDPLDLNGLIQDVMVLYAQEPSETATRAQVVIDLDPTLPLIEGDAQQLRQVVHNLIQNAQDASELNSKVTLTTRWSPARKRVKLTVADEGHGFSPNILQRAFEPYVTTKAKGTGLGLAVVKKIADEHGARLDIANLVEEGVVKGAQVSLSFSVEKLAQS